MKIGKWTCIHIHTSVRVWYDFRYDSDSVCQTVAWKSYSYNTDSMEILCQSQEVASQITFLSFSRMVCSLCWSMRFNDITSSFSWLIKMKLSVPPESIDWVIELLEKKKKKSWALKERLFQPFHTEKPTNKGKIAMRITCLHWMALSLVWVFSLVFPSECYIREAN